jgi:adenylate cyclase
VANQDRPREGTEDWWRQVLTDPTVHFEPFRNLFLRLPSSPHCKLCGAPFKGIGGAVMRPMGFRPWPKNPTLCQACMRAISRIPAGGAEIECTLLFADIRGSTGIAERSNSTAYAELLHRFYAAGSDAVIAERGILDKFVGDEIVAIFVPAFSGPRHAGAAIRAAGRMLELTGHGDPGGPWVTIGIGIHEGPAFVGSVAVGPAVNDFTALGDTVNAAARLASEAAAGEVLISESALSNAGIREDGLPRRELRLRGRETPLTVAAAGSDTLPAVPARDAT